MYNPHQNHQFIQMYSFYIQVKTWLGPGGWWRVPYVFPFLRGIIASFLYRSICSWWQSLRVWNSMSFCVWVLPAKVLESNIVCRNVEVSVMSILASWHAPITLGRSDTLVSFSASHVSTEVHQRFVFFLHRSRWVPPYSGWMATLFTWSM